MSERYFRDLVIAGMVDGRSATPQDYQDALRALRDQSTRYYQLGDDYGEALASLATVQVVAAMSRKYSPVPY